MQKTKRRIPSIISLEYNEDGSSLISKNLKILIEISKSFICPMTHLIMTAPVIASDGYTYEKEAIELILQTDNPKSPLTGEQLEHETLPDKRLNMTIRCFYKEILLCIDDPYKLSVSNFIIDPDTLQDFFNYIIDNNINQVLSIIKHKHDILLDFQKHISRESILYALLSNCELDKIEEYINKNKIEILEEISKIKLFTSALLLEFLNAVVNGDIYKAKKMMEETYHSSAGEVSGKLLCIMKGTVLDHTGTLYRNVSGIQLTILISHFAMFSMLQKCFGKDKIIASQIQDLLDRELLNGSLFKEFTISLYTKYIDKLKHLLESGEYNTRNDDTIKNIGKLQHGLPKYILYEFYDQTFHAEVLQHEEDLTKHQQKMQKFYSSITIGRLGLEYTLVCTTDETTGPTCIPLSFDIKITSKENIDDLINTGQTVKLTFIDWLKKIALPAMDKDKIAIDRLLIYNQENIKNAVEILLNPQSQNQTWGAWFRSFLPSFSTFTGAQQTTPTDDPNNKRETPTMRIKGP